MSRFYLTADRSGVREYEGLCNSVEGIDAKLGNIFFQPTAPDVVTIYRLVETQPGVFIPAAMIKLPEGGVHEQDEIL